MKKRLYLLTTILSFTGAAFLSSCLKDNSNYVDFSKVGTLAELPNSGKIGFAADALTESSDTIVRQFAVNIASPSPLKSDITVTLAIDPAVITAYNTANPSVTFNPFPSNAYSFSTLSVTIPAGTREKILTVIFYKNKLDPSQSYMLPISIKSTSNPSVTISGNFGVHYYHFIGNDFAGTYVWDYTRYNSNAPLPSPSGGSFTGHTAVISPVTPTEFTVATGYNSQGVRYDVTFTRTVTGGVVSYSNWNVSFVTADVTGIWGAAGITVTQQPVFQIVDPVKKEFRMQYIDYNGSANRYIIDDYHK